MTEYISKSALLAEIEKRRRDWWFGSSTEAKFKREECDDILSFLDTLEVKEVENFIWNNARTTVPEDSTNQIICIKEDGLAVSTIGKIVNGTVKWAYLDNLLNANSFNIKVKETDLEQEIDDYVNEYFSECGDGVLISDASSTELTLLDVTSIAKHFYELGLKAQRE